MFCRNCGRELIEVPEVCPECGAKPTKGSDFCPSCGVPTSQLTEICPECGARVAGRPDVWMPSVAGALDLFAGVPALLLGVLFAKLGGTTPFAATLGVEWLFNFLAAISTAMVVMGGIAILGGLAALRRGAWRVALVGSVCALFCHPLSFVVGIPAIIFTILGKKHFAKKEAVPTESKFAERR